MVCWWSPGVLAVSSFCAISWGLMVGVILVAVVVLVAVLVVGCLLLGLCMVSWRSPGGL